MEALPKKEPVTTTPKERLYQEKRGMGPYEGNWHPDEVKTIPTNWSHAKNWRTSISKTWSAKEVEWYLYK